jgi:polyphosphate kinase 2 (PPK2 family)
VELTEKQYEKELLRLQTELVYMQEWIVSCGKRLVVVFEGRDTAGKDGVIKRVIAFLNPRSCRVVAVPTPDERERTRASSAMSRISPPPVRSSCSIAAGTTVRGSST